jgi:hypothetical protein
MRTLEEDSEELRAAEHSLQFVAAIVFRQGLDPRVCRIAGNFLDAEVALGEAIARKPQA